MNVINTEGGIKKQEVLKINKTPSTHEFINLQLQLYPIGIPKYNY